MKLTRIETDGTVHTPRPLKAFGPHPEPTPTMDAPPYIVMCEDTTKGVQVDGQLCVPIAAFCNALEDARLFAAAPDLLAACKYALARFEHGPEAITNPNDSIVDDLRAAIRKAEGGAAHV